jgi:hypothetical protein
MSEWFLAASMDIDPFREETFNRIYDQEHIPEILTVPGLRSVSRLIRQDELRISIGGRTEVVRFATEPRYTALYELDSPGVLTSPEWSTAVEVGRWSTEVRPFTRNRRHVLLRQISKEVARQRP